MIKKCMTVSLAVISLLVLIGQIQQKNMWGWITLYWVVLTVKNGYDLHLLKGEKKNGTDTLSE